MFVLPDLTAFKVLMSFFLVMPFFHGSPPSLTTTTAVTLTSSPKTCSYGWTEFQVGMEKRCLKYMGKKDADKAESTCKSENARLPLPRSDQENSDYSEDWV